MWVFRCGPGPARGFALDLPPLAGKDKQEIPFLEFPLDFPLMAGKTEHKDTSPESALDPGAWEMATKDPGSRIRG